MLPMLVRCRYRGFNPCFDGSVARGQNNDRNFEAIHVSILVLMEV